MEELTEKAMPFFEEHLPAQIERPLNRDYVQQVVSLEQERAKTLAELPQPELALFFFLPELVYPADLLLSSGSNKEKAVEVLGIALQRLRMVEPFDAASLESLLRPLAQELGLKTGEFFGLLRVATTGLTAAPPLFQTMAVLGKERCLERIKAAIRRLQES